MIEEATQETVTPIEARLNAARATIAALEKRIAELEGAWNKAQDRNAKLEQTLSIMIDSNRKDLHALTIERQRREECEAAYQDVARFNNKWQDKYEAERKRREECEAVLREVANAPNRIAENARIIADYFSRYSSTENHS